MQSNSTNPVHGNNTLAPVDGTLAAFLALLLFGIYMLTFDGTLHSTDGLSMIAVAENIVKHDHFDTRQLEDWENVHLGVDGNPYTKYPLGPTLLMLPFMVVALAWPQLGLIQTTMVLMPLATALTGVTIYLSARRLGYPPKIGLVVTLLTGLATMAWPRTRDLVADPLILLSFTATFYYALAYRQDKKLGQAALMGLALSLTVLHKVSNIVTVPLFCWYLAALDFDFSNFSLKRIDWVGLMTPAIAGAISLLLIGGYNLVRFANPWETGYESGYTTPFWLGLAGLLISPYKSLFLYIPLFVLIPVALKEAWQQYRREATLILSLLISHLLIFAPWHDWGGGGTWGPRFLAPLNGLLVLLLLPFINQAFQPNPGFCRISLIILASTSLFVQLLGISARDNVYLGAASYWTSPPNPSLWGELSWHEPDQWPIWGHLLRFDLGSIPVIWRWQWANLIHFDWLTLLAALLIVAMGLSGVIIFYRREQAAKLWPVGAWLVSAMCVAFMLGRNYDDPRSIERASETSQLWPAYHSLMAQLPSLVRRTDAVIFTDRRFEFYLFNKDKTAAQRYLIAKPSQPQILEIVPKLLQQQAEHGRIWLVTDDLDNRLFAYAIELWLKERASPVGHYLFGDRVQLTAFEVYPSVTWEAMPPEPQLAGLVKPPDYTFKGIAALLGWNWPGLPAANPPMLQSGQTYDFELYWIYWGKASEDLFFIRLLDDSGQVAVQAFTTPRPDNRLIPGQLLLEDAALTLPNSLAPGLYHLQIGLLTRAVDTGELTFPLPAEMTEIEVR